MQVERTLELLIQLRQSDNSLEEVVYRNPRIPFIMLIIYKLPLSCIRK